MTIKILFTGGVTRQIQRDVEDYTVGPSGDLRLYERVEAGKRVHVVVAPGQWRYIEVDK
jgi:hypothetical protein